MYRRSKNMNKFAFKVLQRLFIVFDIKVVYRFANVKIVEFFLVCFVCSLSYFRVMTHKYTLGKYSN